jgi:glycosyltransferase involved in cell wall biosynthesis
MDRLTGARVPSPRHAPDLAGTAPSEGLRILHVSETYGGGVETLVRQFAAAQVSRGHAVGLLVPPGMAGVQGVERNTWEPRRRRPTSAGPAVVALRRAVREHRPDVVHLHSFGAGVLGRLPGCALTGMDVPVVYQPHSWSFDVFGHRSAAAAMRAWERRAARRTDVLVVNCWDEVREGRRAGVATSARVLGVPVDLDGFRPATEDRRLQARRDLGLPGRHVVLCVGRLARQKGQDLLVEAWEHRRLADTVLVLLGPGDPAPLRAVAPGQWGRSILAVGGQDDVRPWLQAADLAVQPSRYEGFSVVVAEVMASGVPIVATAVNGVREAVVDGPPGAAGAAVAIGDMGALLDEVEKRLADPELRRREGTAGRARAERLFRGDHVMARLDDAYRQAIRAHGHGVDARETTW